MSLWSAGSQNKVPPCASERQRQLSWRNDRAGGDKKKNNTHHQQLHQCVLPQGFKAGLENQEKGQKDGGEVKHDAVLEYFRMKDIKKRGDALQMWAYLVVNGDLRVGVSLVERFDLTDVLLQRKLHHSEHHRHLCWQLGELQLSANEGAREE